MNSTLNFQVSDNITFFPALEISQMAGDDEFQKPKDWLRDAQLQYPPT